MEIFIGITLFVFGILQIILFFKIWGMANNVKTIKNEQPNRNKSISAKIAYLRGDKGLAQRLMDEHFFETARGYAVGGISWDFEKNYNNLVIQATALYTKMDLKAPDFEKYKDRDLLIISAN